MSSMMSSNINIIYQNIRLQEIKRIFKNCPTKIFNHGLELGAGNGYQSTLLGTYIKKLISTDLNDSRLNKNNTKNIEYKICDAENIQEHFSSKQFDVIFSSNLLEHIPNIDRTLHGIYTVLKNEGITIHSIPSPFWKLSTFVLYMPNLFRLVIRKAIRIVFKNQKHMNNKNNTIIQDNNLKIKRKKKNILYHLFFPAPHGISSSHFQEFLAFRKSRWVKIFNEHGFNIVSIKKGPVSSGYRFGFNHIRLLLEKLGYTSEYIYILTKKNNTSPYLQYFE